MRIAIVQQPPCFLNLQATTDRAIGLLEQAVDSSAGLVVFPETWLPGYPVWIDDAPGACLWDHPPAKALFRHLRQNAPTIDGPEITRLSQAAQRTGSHVVIGIHEKSGGSLYNSMVFLAPDGGLAVRRKLVPTYTERLLWGRGDGSGLFSIDTDFGPLGGLICWEHWMPLARAAMHATGETVHVAQWPWVKDPHQLASRHYAFEGRCFVLASGCVMNQQDMLEGFDSSGGPAEARELLEQTGTDGTNILRGGSAVIGPDGNYLVEPVFDNPDTVFADLDSRLIEESRLTLDVDGHYSRPDVFTLSVNTARQTNVEFDQAEPRAQTRPLRS